MREFMREFAPVPFRGQLGSREGEIVALAWQCGLLGAIFMHRKAPQLMGTAGLLLLPCARVWVVARGQPAKLWCCRLFRHRSGCGSDQRSKLFKPCRLI